MKNTKRQPGFSLTELLMVVIILGIIAAFAIPSLVQSRRDTKEASPFANTRPDEASAIANIRNVHTAEAAYLNIGGAYGTLEAVSGANLLDNTWTGTPTKNGYQFALTLGAGGKSFCVTATPTSTEASSRSFAISHRGVIYSIGRNDGARL